MLVQDAQPGMEETPVVTVFLRSQEEVLLLCRSDEVGSYQGKWGAVAGHVEDDPELSARREIREETGIDPDQTTLVSAGDPFAVEDADLDTQWLVHPFLFDCTTRNVEPNYETTRLEWTAPTEILDRETVPDLWRSYDQVRPTAETVAEDTEHGSTYLSVRALAVLRDEAALARRAEPASEAAIETVARELLAARPSMAVVTNRINRVMATAETPAAVENGAHEGINRALRVDSEAATRARELLGDRVATLSRSGTVLQALESGRPAAVLVAESRPGREGIVVAEALAADTAVTVTTDAAFAHALAGFDADSLVVGADAVLADGRLVNKVGTRQAAMVAQREGVEVLAVTASDKIRPGTDYDLEPRAASEVYDGSADIAVENPTFDVTPSDCLDAVVTERGVLDSGNVERIATEHEKLAAWDESA